MPILIQRKGPSHVERVGYPLSAEVVVGVVAFRWFRGYHNPGTSGVIDRAANEGKRANRWFRTFLIGSTHKMSRRWGEWASNDDK
jgi:hypothetical protein